MRLVVSSFRRPPATGRWCDRLLVASMIALDRRQRDGPPRRIIGSSTLDLRRPPSLHAQERVPSVVVVKAWAKTQTVRQHKGH